MIKAKPKPFGEILNEVKDLRKLLIAGCDGCVTVCEAGGLKEAQLLASALRMHFKKEGKEAVVDELSLTRQCDKEYLMQIADRIDDYDAVVSLACGCGVQFMAEAYPKKLVFPGVDTCFMGVNEERGVWTERCAGCGQCILASTGGICPIARCSKRMLNGPCGGSSGGKCEVSKETDCAWQLIYDRLKELGRLELFEQPVVAKDWSTSRDGGPRKIIKEAASV